MRKLATIRRIDNITPIEGADAIEVAVIGGWTVVVKKGEYRIGDQAVYLEIDSWVPTELAPFLSKGNEPREYNGVKGERLRTVKLRGQISQGLLLPMSVLAITTETGDRYMGQWEGFDGHDVSERLGIQKWEQALPSEIAGQVAGVFPGFIPRTDEERCQNIVPEIFGYADEWREIDASAIPQVGLDALNAKGLLRKTSSGYEKLYPATADINTEYEVSMKMDGTSWTGFFYSGNTGVCSRNYELKVEDVNKTNSLVRMFIDSGIQSALVAIGKNVAVQGELMGPGIQGNRENLPKNRLFIFNVFNIDEQRKMTPEERIAFLDELFAHGVDQSMVTHAPILHARTTLQALGVGDVSSLLKFAEGPSLTHKVREGLVFKRVDGKFSFKAISNDFLVRGYEK